MNNQNKLSIEQLEELLNTLKDRFEKNKDRHKGLDWAKIQAKLEAIGLIIKREALICQFKASQSFLNFVSKAFGHNFAKN